jgi:hypothetical protein
MTGFPCGVARKVFNSATRDHQRLNSAIRDFAILIGAHAMIPANHDVAHTMISSHTMISGHMISARTMIRVVAFS